MMEGSGRSFFRIFFGGFPAQVPLNQLRRVPCPFRKFRWFCWWKTSRRVDLGLSRSLRWPTWTLSSTSGRPKLIGEASMQSNFHESLDCQCVKNNFGTASEELERCVSLHVNSPTIPSDGLGWLTWNNYGQSHHVKSVKILHGLVFVDKHKLFSPRPFAEGKNQTIIFTWDTRFPCSGSRSIQSMILLFKNVMNHVVLFYSLLSSLFFPL